MSDQLGGSDAEEMQSHQMQYRFDVTISGLGPDEHYGGSRPGTGVAVAEWSRCPNGSAVSDDSLPQGRGRGHDKHGRGRPRIQELEAPM